MANIVQDTSYTIIGVSSNGWYQVAINLRFTTQKSCWIGGGKVTGSTSGLPVTDVSNIACSTFTTQSSCTAINYCKWSAGPYTLGSCVPK